VARYEFLTTWLLEAPLEPVWAAIYDAESYPRWWRGVESVVELEPGQDPEGLGIGNLARYTWRSRLPYTLEFDMRVTRVERPHLLAGQASGELEGEGIWRFYEGAQGTAVTYHWLVNTTRPWMNVLTPLLRPAFAWNHDLVMRQGGEGLARLLGARLLART
jgi:uncharacterized protein YndB with AHSA1/START domain